MPDERRNHQRVRINLPVKWDAMTGIHEARLQDISHSGCFVDTRARVEVNEDLHIQICLPSDEWLHLRGTVTSYQPGIGFGLLFLYGSEEEEKAVKELCYYVLLNDAVLD